MEYLRTRIFFKSKNEINWGWSSLKLRLWRDPMHELISSNNERLINLNFLQLCRAKIHREFPILQSWQVRIGKKSYTVAQVHKIFQIIFWRNYSKNRSEINFNQFYPIYMLAHWTMVYDFDSLSFNKFIKVLKIKPNAISSPSCLYSSFLMKTKSIFYLG